MGKIIYDPKNNSFNTKWDMMELRYDGATVWVDGKSYELTEDESADLLFQNTTAKDTGKIINKLSKIINEQPTANSVSKVKGLLKELLGDELDIFLN